MGEEDRTAVVVALINYQITVTNPGTGTATNVLLTDQFDPGLEHESKSNPVELRVGNLDHKPVVDGKKGDPYGTCQQ